MLTDAYESRGSKDMITFVYNEYSGGSIEPQWHKGTKLGNAFGIVMLTAEAEMRQVTQRRLRHEELN